MPWVSQPESKAKRARNRAEEVGEAIVSRRLARIALDEDSPILTGSFSEAEGWKVFDQVTVSAVAKQGAWREALVLVEREYRRAIEHGFTQAEVDEPPAIRRPAHRPAVAGAMLPANPTLAHRRAGAGDEA